MCRGRYNVEYTVNAGARCLLHVFGASGVRFLLFFCMFGVPFDFFGSLGHLWKPILFAVEHKLGAAGVRMGENCHHIYFFYTNPYRWGGEVVFFGVGLDATPPSRHEFGGLCTRSATVSRTSRTTVPPCHSSSDRISKPLLW